MTRRTTMRARPTLLIPALAVITLLAGCSVPAPTSTTASAGSASHATPSTAAPTARPVPSPSVTAYFDPSTPDPPAPVTDTTGTRTGCASPTGTIPAGAATTPIADIDGDGKVDTEFLTTRAPFEYGIRTAAGALFTVDDPLPRTGLHSAWTTLTDSTFRTVAVLDDGRTALLFTVNDCALTPIRTTDGDDFSLPLTRTADRSTGVACTNQNGGLLIAAEETRRRPDGDYDLYQALIQPARGTNPDAKPDQAGLDDFAPPARYTDLSPTDPRITQASGSYCWNAPRRVQIAFQ